MQLNVRLRAEDTNRNGNESEEREGIQLKRRTCYALVRNNFFFGKYIKNCHITHF